MRCRHCDADIRWDGNAWVSPTGTDDCKVSADGQPGWAHARPLGTSHAPKESSRKD